MSHSSLFARWRTAWPMGTEEAAVGRDFSCMSSLADWSSRRGRTSQSNIGEVRVEEHYPCRHFSPNSSYSQTADPKILMRAMKLGHYFELDSFSKLSRQNHSFIAIVCYVNYLGSIFSVSIFRPSAFLIGRIDRFTKIVSSL